ncbi:FtsB family cell division protein [Flavobacterium filum]|uniref:FtsB family cell division protein n=1 Tax=Flavobacterium filum TaxID=370974 RepID=UPI00041F054A|nr:septum formation initiator family protein [Flavobacterium filum]
MKFIQRLKEKYPWFKYVGNRYVFVFLFFAVWMLFLDNYSYLEHRVLNEELDELETNKEYYQDEIKKDCLDIKRLNNPDQIEKYAREKYYMKRDSEDIYIIEFEEDILPKEEENNKSL